METKLVPHLESAKIKTKLLYKEIGAVAEDPYREWCYTLETPPVAINGDSFDLVAALPSVLLRLTKLCCQPTNANLQFTANNESALLRELDRELCLSIPQVFPRLGDNPLTSYAVTARVFLHAFGSTLCRVSFSRVCVTLKTAAGEELTGELGKMYLDA